MDNLIELATFNDDNFGTITEFINDKYEVVFYKQVENNYEELSEEDNTTLKNKYLGGE